MKKIITLGSGGIFEKDWIMHDIIAYLVEEGVIKLEDDQYHWLKQDIVLVVEVAEK